MLKITQRTTTVSIPIENMADVATHRAPSLPTGKQSKQSTPQKLKKVDPKPVDESASQAEDVMSNGVTNGEHEEGTENGEYDNITHDETQEAEEEDDGTEGVVPAGSIDQDGNVVDEDGKIIGHVNAETASHFPNSMVDNEGDVLDADGNVVGKAELDHLKDTAESTTKDIEKPDVDAAGTEKPELEAPFGVQDNGEITNASGVAVGKLVEGEPRDLVGTSIKDIDAEGNLKAASGSVLGKADLNSGADAVEDALPEDGKSEKPLSQIGSQVGSQASGAQKKLGETGSEVPDVDEAGSQVPDVEKKLDEEGNPLPEEPKLDEEGNPLPEELRLDADGKEIPTEPKLDEEGNPLPEEPKLDTDGKEIPAEPKLDEEGNPIPEEPKLDADGKEIPEESKLDEEGNPIPEEPKLDNDGKEIPEEPKLDEEGNPIPEEPKLDADGKEIPEEPKLDKDGNPLPDEPQLDADGNPLELPKVDEEGNPLEKIDLSLLKGMKVNKAGLIVDSSGTPFGKLLTGEAKKLIGKKVDAEGQIWDDSGKVIGTAELLPEGEREAEPEKPFEDFPDSVLDAKGNVMFEGRVVGKLVEGDAKKLEGKKVDADGDVVDKNGNQLGRAERWQEEDAPPEEVPEAEDLSILEGMKINKAGNVVNDQGKLFGKVVSGEVSKLIGRKVGTDGQVFSESGKVIGKVELIPVDEREEDSGSPFEDFPNSIIDKHGNVLFEGQVVGKLIEGDAKKLVGKKIDKDGEVVDKIGNVLGKAERWIEEDAPEPEKVDMSILAGKRVNKLGNIVDKHGSIFGHLIEGDAKKLNGKMCDKDGIVWDDGGKQVGKAELAPESERDAKSDGPFAGFDSPTVAKDGKVADSKGSIIGRVIEGDAKKLYGKAVDDDGDILDKNGNSMGKAERWEEPEKEKTHSPVAGRKVNKKGFVLDEAGDEIAKLTDGDISKCAGMECDDDQDVYNQKGQVVGHVTLIGDLPEPEPEPEPVVEEPKETPEEMKEREQLEQDKKLASQMAYCIQGSLDKITPILKMITDAIETAERQPKEELDEQKLVDTVRPLLEQGGQILQEANGVIRGLDPDGRIAANAKHKTASREATPEEHRLAEVLKELTGTVTQTIENAKKKIAGMPHAKKELNPLWGLLAEPLGQILAAVGLLLAGVLGLVGRLLSGLGLGGLLDNLLGGLGLKGILKGLGLGMVTKSLTGKD